HGEQRNFAAADGAGGGEQRSVAAEHDHQVAAFRNFLARMRLASWGVGGGFLIAARTDAALSEPLDQIGNQLHRRWHIGLRKNADRPNVGHTGEIPYSLPRPVSGSR